MIIIPTDFIEQLKSISIVDVLRDLYGIESHKKGERYFCKIRSERTESCCIYPSNTFYDFGGGEGGDVINLLSLLSSCSNKEAQQKLSDYSGITRIGQARDRNELVDYEWKKLGIEPGRVSQNINIYLLVSPDDKPNWRADFNLKTYDSEAVESFESVYHQNIWNFRKDNPKEYHEFLKKKVLLMNFIQQSPFKFENECQIILI